MERHSSNTLGCLFCCGIAKKTCGFIMLAVSNTVRHIENCMETGKGAVKPYQMQCSDGYHFRYDHIEY